MRGNVLLSHRWGVFLHVFLAASSINRSALHCQPREFEAVSGSECRRLSFPLAPLQAKGAGGVGGALGALGALGARAGSQRRVRCPPLLTWRGTVAFEIAALVFRR